MGHSSDSDSDSDSSSDRRRREKRSKKDKDKKSKKDKDKKDKDKKDKDKKDKERRSKRSRTPERGAKSKPMLTALKEFDIDAALQEEDRQIFEESLKQQERLQPSAEATRIGGGQLTVQSGSSALTLVPPGSTALIAPDAKSEKIRAYAQVARESRRVHVSHIPRGMDPEQLKQMFRIWCAQIRRKMIETEIGRTLDEDCIVDIDHVEDVFINGRGNIPFAFIELSTDDMCTKLITGDLPVEFPLANGGTTKVGCRRPRDYKPMMGIDRSRIMMVGLATPEADVATYRQLLEALGEINTFAVIPRRGYYVEYADPKSGDAACQALNGERIGDRVIVVQPTTEAIRAWFLHLDIPVTGLLDENGTGGLTGDLRKDVMGDLLNLQTGVTQAIETFVAMHDHLKVSWPMILPTRILCIFNAFDKAELDETEDSYDNLVEDLSEELEKYGRVKRLIVPHSLPKPPLPPDDFLPPPKPVPTPMSSASIAATKRPDFRPDETALIDPTGLSDAAYQVELARWTAECAAGEKKFDEDLEAYRRARAQWDMDCSHPVFGTPGLGRCYVEYETADEAEAAQAGISGRLFGGRTIVTSFLFEDILYPPPEEEEKEDAAAAAANTDGDTVKDAAAANASAEAGPATTAEPAAAAEDID